VRTSSGTASSNSEGSARYVWAATVPGWSLSRPQQNSHSLIGDD